MNDIKTMSHVINSQADLNLAFFPFIKDGGLFIPTQQSFNLGEKIMLDLQLPTQTDTLLVESKVVWIIPANALYYIFAGIGVQFIGPNKETICEQIKTNLDTSLEVGGYIFGLSTTLDRKDHSPLAKLHEPK